MGRATATVLFTDLVGSTELRGRLGEEAAEELRRRHDRLLTEAVEAHSGRVVKGLGDGIMATFAGAADAVAAAVAIQQAIDRLNRSGKAPVPLAVRVGLSAGDVSFEGDDVHGTPVIEASRLCGVAGGGEVLASEMVRWLARSGDSQGFVSVGSLELKGLAEPVPAVRVQWEPAAVSTIPMPALLTDMGRIFVGRDAELERLRQLWKEAAAGERRVALLAGEPGVGKTRLAAELAEAAHTEGGIVLAGRCDEDLGVPYQPFVEALRHFADHTSEENLAAQLGRYGGELVRLLPELAERLPGLPAPLRSDPETERYRLFDAVAAWLAAASTDEPVLLVVDDLQWAAKPTLLLLRHVVRSVDPRRLLTVGAYRDTELGHDHPLVDVLADLRRHGGVERFSLTGLDSSGVAAFMEQAAGHALDDQDMALVRAIHQETEGNPFFVREVLRHLTETGAIEWREGRWTIPLPVEELGIPESVRDVVGRRLSRLSEEANQALRMAAVVGLEFEFAVVRAAGSIDEDILLSCLEEATEARLIIEETVPCYRFAHALVRDTLYAELTAARRVALHRRVAEAIEGVHATSLDNYLPALAHHWVRASAPAADTAKAVEYAARAGHRALAQLAHDEAVAYYRQALQLLDASGPVADEEQRCELLISLGEAERRGGDPRHRETLLAAARLAQKIVDPDRLARAALANNRGAWSASFGTDPERVAILEAALDATGSGDDGRRARLLANLGAELVWTGDRPRRLAFTAEALEIARRVGDPSGLAYSLLARATSTCGDPAFVADSLAAARELADLAEDLGDPFLQAWAGHFRFWGAFQTGLEDEANEALNVSTNAAEEAAQPALQWFSVSSRAGLMRVRGRFSEAEGLAREALEIGIASGQPDAPLFFGQQRFDIRYDQGRLDEILPRVEQTVHETARPVVRVLLALLYCELDRDADARRTFETFAPTEIAADSIWLVTMAIACGVCTQLNDTGIAEVLYDLLRPYTDQVAGSPVTWGGPVAYGVGLLATTLGRFHDAEAHFATAAAMGERIGAPAWLARTRLEWARMLLARRQSGDADRARELLSQALATARELGLGNVERRAVALLGELE